MPATARATALPPAARLSLRAPLLLLAQPPGHRPPQAPLPAAVVGAIAGPEGIWCLLEMAATLPIVVASLGYLITPALRIAWSLGWIGEAPDAGLMAGAALILGSVDLVAWPR